MTSRVGLRIVWCLGVLALALAGACTNANAPSQAKVDPPPATQPGRESPSEGETPGNGDADAQGNADVLRSAAFKRTWLGKPPMAKHYFDLTFQNPSDEARWIVFSEVFHYEGQADPALAEGALAELSADVISADPRAVLVRGVGSHLWAVKLAGGARLTLEDVPVESWWERTPESDEIEVIVATEFLVQGKPIESQLELELLTVAERATVPPSGQAEGGETWHPADLASAVPVELEVESRSKRRVTFSAP